MYTSESEIVHSADVPAPRQRAIQLRKVDVTQSELVRRLGTGLRAELKLDATTTLTLELSGLRQASGTSGRRPLLQHTPAGVLALSPARELVRALTAIDVPNDTSDVLHQLRLDIAAQAMPPGWLPLFGASNFLFGEAEALGPLELTLTVFQQQAQLGLTVALRGSSDALLHALSQPGWLRIDADAALQTLRDDLPIKAPVLIGMTELSLPALDKLVPGDVVLVNRPRFNLQGEGELQIAHVLAKCVLLLGNHPRLEITEWHPTDAGHTMNHRKDHLAGHGAAAADAPLDEVSVTLSFELGELDLTLSELRNLAPGSVLQIVGGMPPQVAIRAGNRRIGIGELVELGDQLAVEIHRIGVQP